MAERVYVMQNGAIVEEEILRLSEEIVAGLIVLGNQGLGGRFSRMRRSSSLSSVASLSIASLESGVRS